MRRNKEMLPEIPNWLIWLLLVAVIIQGFSMALLVYLMFKKEAEEEKSTDEPPEEEVEEESQLEK